MENNRFPFNQMSSASYQYRSGAEHHPRPPIPVNQFNPSYGANLNQFSTNAVQAGINIQDNVREVITQCQNTNFLNPQSSAQFNQNEHIYTHSIPPPQFSSSHIPTSTAVHISSGSQLYPTENPPYNYNPHVTPPNIQSNNNLFGNTLSGKHMTNLTTVVTPTTMQYNNVPVSTSSFTSTSVLPFSVQNVFPPSNITMSIPPPIHNAQPNFQVNKMLNVPKPLNSECADSSNVGPNMHQQNTVPSNVVFIPQMMPPTPCNTTYPIVQPLQQMPLPSHGLPYDSSGHQIAKNAYENVTAVIQTDDQLVQDFLTKVKSKSGFPEKKKKKPTPITVAQFRCILKEAFGILKEIATTKEVLKRSLDLNEEMWNDRLKHVKELQCQLTNICNMLLNDAVLLGILEKLKKINKKRKRIRASRAYRAACKEKQEQKRLLVRQKIDQWLEMLREKDLQEKREIEMKKEADSILSEVRKKIQEAKRTIEKLKIFQKLRQARKDNALKKGLFLLSKHDQIFETKLSELKETMLRQLSDYEAEEKALKVMLDTEQEGQREEEAKWKLNQLRKHQEKKRDRILQCLFGESEPPTPSDPLYFFWQHYDGGNRDINTLLKIRQEWDMFLVPRDNKEGSSIPQRWVVPDAPSSEMWAEALVETVNVK